MKKRVFVGMSGGVDSSVSAAILKHAGYDVTGVFIKTWSPEWLPCTWREERRDAMRVAAKLKIPLITLDLEKEYKRDVADYMIAEYRAGRVPNPDVMCNKTIKFGAFFDYAMSHGADFVATGHYARVCKAKGFYGLSTSADADKDQTYFLWTLTQRQLPRIIFPIGHLKKRQVRALAKKFDLPVAEKKDSQGLCFMGKIDVKDFLKHYIKEKRGRVVDRSGEVIGHHCGATFFTLGERHGFVIDKKTAGDRPYYVIGKDTKKNILVVSHDKVAQGVVGRELMISDINWCSGVEPDFGKRYAVRVRYRQTLRACSLENMTGKKAKIVFDEPQEVVAPGQSVVIYVGDICLGGGIV